MIRFLVVVLFVCCGAANQDHPQQLPKEHLRGCVVLLLNGAIVRGVIHNQWGILFIKMTCGDL